ncbi:unnamed protein product [Cylicocyclus nassatus]|uniref:Uncharacterized protein n=1 Tax=Cylicocyclus nassatus TaxID=53992 RepID=A0AA36H688_CYLNA|nr:unnamed protein product [Cylicocyclus nassatus]
MSCFGHPVILHSNSSCMRTAVILHKNTNEEEMLYRNARKHHRSRVMPISFGNCDILKMQIRCFRVMQIFSIK